MSEVIKIQINKFRGKNVKIIHGIFKGQSGKVVDVEEYGEKTTFNTLRFGVELENGIYYHWTPEIERVEK